MSNKKNSPEDRPNPAKNGSGNPKERNDLQADQEKKTTEGSDTKTDQLVTGQSDADVNGNQLNKNLRHSPAH